jgi:hypothetical protein
VPDPADTPGPVAATFTPADGSPTYSAAGESAADAFRNLVREAVARKYPNAPNPEADRQRSARRRADG